MSRKSAIYARVSTHHQELENQLAELRVVCERNSWDVVQVFTDFGISGAKGRGARKGLDDLLKAVVRREIDQVCVWSIDRLGAFAEGPDQRARGTAAEGVPALRS